MPPWGTTAFAPCSAARSLSWSNMRSSLVSFTPRTVDAVAAIHAVPGEDADDDGVPDALE